MGKFIKTLLAFAVFLSLTACGGDSSEIDENDKTPQDSSSDTSVNNNSETKETEVEIEEQVIFEEKDIKVTVTGINYDGWFGPEVKVLIENNSSKNITVQALECAVNGMMTETLFSTDVASGKKANDSITLSSSNLENGNVKTIKEIEVKLNVFDSDSWDDIVKSDLISIKTSAYDGISQEFDTTGFVAYEDSNYRFVVKKLDSEDSFWGADIFVYIENNSEDPVTFQLRDVSIDGFMVDSMFSADVLPGKIAYDTISFFESDLEENGIEDISEIEFKLHIFNTDSWKDIKNTDPITITFE